MGCVKCGNPLRPTDTFMYCRPCSQIAALRMATCDYCTVDVEYDESGHARIIHQPGCPWLSDFRLKARIIADELDNPGQ